MHSLDVKLEGIERRKRSTGLLHIAAASFLLAKGVDYLVYFNYQNLRVVILVFIVVALSLIYGFLKRKIDPKARYNHWVRLLQVILFTVLGINFIAIGRQLDVLVLFTWAIICMFLLFTERKVFHDSSILFKEDGIFIPGYFRNRRLFWSNVKEVVARPDYITIFQKNDKYLQFEVLSQTDSAMIEELNLYCNQQIAQTANTTIN
jgi:hypothetical protein